MMQKKLPFLLLLSFLLFSIPSIAQENIPWLKGYWEGVGFQPPTDSKWEVELQYDSTTNQLMISYPSLSCGGHWDLVELRDGYAEFKERITEGLQNCDNNGKVIVTRIDAEYISVAYFLPGYYDGVVAYTVLRKKEVTKVKIPFPKGKVKRT